MLCVRRVVPTDAELARRLGIRAPPPGYLDLHTVRELQESAMEEAP